MGRLLEPELDTGRDRGFFVLVLAQRSLCTRAPWEASFCQRGVLKSRWNSLYAALALAMAILPFSSVFPFLSSSMSTAVSIRLTKKEATEAIEEIVWPPETPGPFSAKTSSPFM